MEPIYSTIEVYKDIPEYEGHYQVSNFGNVKTLKRKLPRLLTPISNKRKYLYVILCKNGNTKLYTIHQLVAIAFLDFKINKHVKVINHINFIKTDNSLENLEIVTNRKNCSMLCNKSSKSSQFTGVSFNKARRKWSAEILIDGKRTKLGCFLIEFDAHMAYQNKLQEYLNKQNEKL